MYKSLMGSIVNVIVGSRAEYLLEYNGKLVNETDTTIELKDVTVSYLLPQFQKGLFGSGITKFKENVATIVINKQYIISCDNN